MADALELGLSVEDFWEMSPRAIYLLTDERVRRAERRAGHRGRGARGASGMEKGPRLSRLPRP